jgi:large-conductance mechanosensitive channel
MDFKGLAWVALALLLVWVVAGLVFKVLGAAIHLLLLAAAVFAIISVVQRVRRRTPHG